MNRRGFLGKVGGAVAAVALAGATVRTEPAPDEFAYRGYRVRWRGWVNVPNQNVAIGMWNAWNANTQKMFASTTHGIAELYRDLDCIDTTRAKGYQAVTSFSSETERATAREKARVNLLRIIDAKG